MEITRTNPHRFSTTAHRGFTTDTAVLLWIHTDLVQRAAANLLQTRERRARRLTERIVQEENFELDYRASEGPRGQVGVRLAIEGIQQRRAVQAPGVSPPPPLIEIVSAASALSAACAFTVLNVWKT